MTIYCVALINITDRERYKTYSQGFWEIFNRYPGKVLSVEGGAGCQRGQLAVHPNRPHRVPRLRFV
jgi:uncharacterized protein (DUF1330 family)